MLHRHFTCQSLFEGQIFRPRLSEIIIIAHWERTPQKLRNGIFLNFFYEGDAKYEFVCVFSFRKFQIDTNYTKLIHT